jgi:GDP-L-fucose synthase
LDKKSKIFVAGHQGLVGSAILRRLRDEGYNHLLLRAHAELDLQVQADVEAFFRLERPDYVFLAAAKVGGILANNIYPADFIYNNLIIQTNTIHAAHLFGVRKLLFLGSSCIYPKLAPQPIKEKHLLTGELEPTNEPYALAKIAGIKLCQSYNRQYGTDFISVMPTNLYGPNDCFDLKTSHVLPALIRKFHLAKLLRQGRYEEIVRDLEQYPLGFDIPNDVSTLSFLSHIGINPENIVLWGSGKVYREFLHVDDLAAACVFLMKNYSGNEIVNIGVGKDVTIKELAGLIKGVVGFDGEITWDASKPDGTPRKLLDVEKLKALGWKPTIDLKRGIEQTYDWYVRSQLEPASFVRSAESERLVEVSA